MAIMRVNEILARNSYDKEQILLINGLQMELFLNRGLGQQMLGWREDSGGSRP